MRLPITVCMIVRDEAEVLGIALSSVRDHVREIVIIDTGSKDGSIEIARAQADTVSSMIWADDFSQARNASIALATEPWALILDADEWIDPRSWSTFSDLTRGPRDRAYLLPQRNYVADAATPGLSVGEVPGVWGVEAIGWMTSRQIRLFPTGFGLAYEGRVHEQIDGTLETAGIARIQCEEPIHHIGKMRDAAILARKQRLYRRLGEAKLEASSDGRSRLELGVQCFELGEDEPAIEMLELALAELEAIDDRAKCVAHLAGVLARHNGVNAAEALLRTHLVELSGFSLVWERYGAILLDARRFARAAEVTERASAIFPDAANLVRMAAEAELGLRQFETAERLYDRLQSMARGSGLGVAGAAIARAGRGHTLPLLRILGGDDDAVRLTAEVGAQRWLDSAWIFSSKIRLVPAAAALHQLSRAYQVRGRLVAAHESRPDLVGASKLGLESIARWTSVETAPSQALRSKIHTAMGAPRWVGSTAIQV